MRFNFFGGAGSGKSTSAAWAFSEMKKSGYSVELVLEYIKTWAYLDRHLKSFDQVYIMSKQLHQEDRLLYSGVKNIVTDCPVILSSIYANYYKCNPDLISGLELIARHFNSTFPAVNIFLKRGDKPYVSEGRYQTEEEAREIDDFILFSLIQSQQRHLYVVDYGDETTLKQIIKDYAN